MIRKKPKSPLVLLTSLFRKNGHTRKPKTAAGGPHRGRHFGMVRFRLRRQGKKWTRNGRLGKGRPARISKSRLGFSCVTSVKMVTRENRRPRQVAHIAGVTLAWSVFGCDARGKSGPEMGVS